MPRPQATTGGDVLGMWELQVGEDGAVTSIWALRQLALDEKERLVSAAWPLWRQLKKAADPKVKAVPALVCSQRAAWP